METVWSDPVIDEVRTVRQRISERVGHDSERLVAYYMKLQEQYRDRLIHSATGKLPTPDAGDTAEPGKSAL